MTNDINHRRLPQAHLRDHLRQNAENWAKALVEVSKDEIRRKGEGVPEVAPLVDGKKDEKHAVVLFLNRHVTPQDVFEGYVNGTPIGNFRPTSRLLIGNYWSRQLREKGGVGKGKKVVKHEVEFGEAAKLMKPPPPPPKPIRSGALDVDHPYGYRSLMKRKELLQADYPELLELLELDVDKSLTPSNIHKGVGKFEALVTLLYLAKKADEFKEPRFKIEEVREMLRQAGFRVNLSGGKCDAFLALTTCNPVRAKSWLLSDDIKNMNLNNNLTEFNNKAREELRKTADALKAKETYQVFKKVYRTCAVSKF